MLPLAFRGLSEGSFFIINVLLTVFLTWSFLTGTYINPPLPSQAQRWRPCPPPASSSWCSAAWASRRGAELCSRTAAPSTFTWRSCTDIPPASAWAQWVAATAHVTSWESHPFLTVCAFCGFQIAADDEIGVKFLSKSLIDDVQVSLFIFLSFPNQMQPFKMYQIV